MIRVGPDGRRHLLLIGAAVLILVGIVLLVQRSGPAFLEAPLPRASEEEVSVEAAPASSLALRLTIPLARLIALLEEAVPRSFGSMEDRQELPGHDRTTLAFSLDRLPISATMNGRVARVATLVEYGLRAYYDPPILPEVSGSCGTGDDVKRRLRVVIEAPLQITSDWRLGTEAKLVALEPPTDEDRDRCEVTFLGIDLTDRVVDGARRFLVDQERTVDSMAAMLDLRPSFEAWWATLREPVQLADSVWLMVGPDAIQQGTLEGSGDSVQVELILTAHPSVVLGPRPEADTTALPPLRAGAFEPGLDLVVEGRTDYGTLSRMLMTRVAGTPVVHEGRTVTVDSLHVFGLGGGRVALNVRVSGDLSARLFFTGTPEIDAHDGTISIPDLDFDVATEDVLVAAAAWIRRGGLRALLRDQASWPLDPVTDRLETWLDEGLNRQISPDLRIVGRVESVTPRAVYALRDHLLVRIGARAEADMIVAGP